MPVNPNEMVMRITPAEALHLLAIDLDEDPEKVLSFLHEKIVQKLLDSPCRPLPNMVKGLPRCIPGCKRPCCFASHRLRANSTIGP